MTGYTDTFTKTAGTDVEANDHETEFSALEAAFHASTGHKHDGTAGEGAKIDVLSDNDNDTTVKVEESADDDTIRFDCGGTEQLTITDGYVLPTLDNDVDLGSATLQFKDAYFNGTVDSDAIVTPDLTATTADINGGTVDGAIIGGSSAAAITWASA